MQLHALSLQPSGAHGAEAEATRQELQPDGGEQGGGLEGPPWPLHAPQLAALLLHAGDQHHDLVERLQPQLEEENTKGGGQVDDPTASHVFATLLLAAL